MSKRQYATCALAAAALIFIVGCGTQRDALLKAIKANDTATVKVLLARRPGLANIQDKDGYTPLHHATGKGNEAMVRLLVAAGADVNAESVDGVTPMLNAACLPKAAGYKTALFLIESGADVSARDKGGADALHYAVAGGSLGLVKLLIERGIDPNRTDKQGFTPLRVAICGIDHPMVAFLSAHGAKPLSIQDAGAIGDIKYIQAALEEEPPRRRFS